MNELLKKFPNIETEYNLAQLTTFKVGGQAKYFLISDDLEEIQAVIKFCLENEIKYQIIGAGSNLLISDQGFAGLIIKINNKDIDVNDSRLKVGAGVLLFEFVNLALKNNLTGHDFLIGIPGSMGGAIYGNAGSYGNDIASIVQSVRIIDGQGNIKELNQEECRFAYRDSYFKHNDCLIFDVVLSLQKGNVDEFRKKMIERFKVRKNIHPMEFGNAGSFFKNIEITEDVKDKLNGKLDISKFDGKKIPAGFLIEQADLKGWQVGGAEVSEKHANFLINKNNAKAQDIFDLADLIKKKVFDKYGIELQEEVQYIGF
ncbi:UDP-N-acetylmuramate dehydrogenase [bacterium]|nr:UDP-N-acetylmuramate dehydrogenase [bacterium]